MNRYLILASVAFGLMLALLVLLPGCVSFPVWSPDVHQADPNTSITVSRVYEQANGATLTVTHEADAGP